MESDAELLAGQRGWSGIVMKQLRSFLSREAAAALENNENILLFTRGAEIFCPVFSLRAALWIKQ